MYQALYRKWRPQTFDDVVGQEHITQTLKRQVQTGRLSHAYLFIGTRGTGKTTCAKILARAVNCEHPVDGNPCNECAACRGILDGSVLDVVELDAASNNGVNDVRALQDEAIFSPASVKKRVYIIDEVHMLSVPAFNALLKILEEPPEHLMFILCTTELRKVLATIVSRCQRHSFKRIDPEAIANRLLYVAGQEGMDLTEDGAALLARLADGGMRDALSLLDQCSAHDRIDAEAVQSAMGLAGNRRIAELLDSICRRQTEEALSRFNALWKDGKDPAGILDELGGLMRDVLLLQVAPRSAGALLSGLHSRAVLKHFASLMSGSDLMDGMDAIRAADLSGSNPRRAAEMCLVRLCVPETGDTLKALRSRVSRLEAMLRNGVPAAAAPSTAAPPLPPEEPAPAPQPDPEPEPLPQPRPAPEPVTEPAPVPQPEPEPEPPEDELPFYTDEDAPPEDPDETPFRASPPPAPEPEPAPAAPPPAAPAAAPAAAEDTETWDLLVRSLNGKLDLGTYSMLTTATQSSGILVGDVMTVCLTTPIARMMLDNAANIDLFQRELKQLTGRTIRVVFSDKPRPAPTADTAAGPDLSKLDSLTKFSVFTIE